MCRPARRGMITNSVFTIGLPTAGVRHTNNRYFKIHFSDNLQRIPHFFFQINEARVKFVFILREITIAKLNSTVERVRNEKWFNVRSKVDTANLTFTYLCIVNTILNYNQKVATFLDSNLLQFFVTLPNRQTVIVPGLYSSFATSIKPAADVNLHMATFSQITNYKISPK